MGFEGMPGELVDEGVILSDEAEASQIYNKGYYGYPMSGGGLELDMLEASYLMEAGRLRVLVDDKDVDVSFLTRRAAEVSGDFEVKFIVYRDLRQRGYVVKAHSDDFDFRVFPRGGMPTTSPTKYWVMAISERAIFDISAFMEQLEKADRIRKELLLAVVDEEGDLTYYQATRSSPKGTDNGPSATRPMGHLIEDRVLVFDEEDARGLYDSGFFGKMMGQTLQLSMIETAYLMERGAIDVTTLVGDEELSFERFRERAIQAQSDFDLRLAAYKDMRARGLVVKTGFKYGCHFRVYERDPKKVHARFLVHAVPDGYRASWPEISRAVRLAHGVKKEILFGRVMSDDVDYLRLKRVRP
jgi:tRNA-intron endonuclease